MSEFPGIVLQNFESGGGLQKKIQHDKGGTIFFCFDYIERYYNRKRRHSTLLISTK
ncbi:hypothetical protein LEP1GSC188_0124 [Leptospira weilii serovar Topaz str. LT2116]|uniref:Uncharacterized protein n=1 Tax=Leptospira weilii serovar Topaz str. LT2116 TaxID=1088540 RepID=M3ENI5_9LEPT|nr:hypothetical protein LEP1GSC188_0124 [Leptospira weilii serovar Topaz str. LT2116]